MSRGPAGRVAVVSGGSSGIGLATVRRLLEDGYRVAFFAARAEHVQQVVADLQHVFDDNRLLGLCADLRSPDEVQAFFRRVESEWESPDTLVCNAGISPKGPDGATPFERMPLAEWDDVLTVNLTGAMLCCQAVFTAMRSSGFGRIILIGSVAARTTPRIAGPAYVASKAALAGLCRSILVSCAGTGITVNLIAPGRILTNLTGPSDSTVNREALQRIPVGRLGRCEDVAALVAFLASEQAGFVNGAVIDVNGGEFAPP